MKKLNSESAQAADGEYIWRTVGDGKVRDGHAVLDGKKRKWSDSPDPTQDYNCRCWAEAVKSQNEKHDCVEESKKYEEARQKVRGLTKQLNDLLLELDQLRRENNELIKRAQKSLGGQTISYILTLPFDRVGVIGELLRRYFGNIINKELTDDAENFMRQRQIIKQKVKNVEDQIVIVRVRLERAAKDLDEAQKELKGCEKRNEK